MTVLIQACAVKRVGVRPFQFRATVARREKNADLDVRSFCLLNSLLVLIASLHISLLVHCKGTPISARRQSTRNVLHGPAVPRSQGKVLVLCFS